MSRSANMVNAMGLATSLWRRVLGRVERLAAPRYRVTLEYPIDPRPRYGEGRPPHRELATLISSRDDAYGATLQDLNRFESNLAAIPEAPDERRRGEPHWNNSYFSALDAIALYGLIGVLRPQRYLEIGSGHSTKFARRAIRDLSLSTIVTSVDPSPRAEIDALCNRVVRHPLEQLDTSMFNELGAGDVLFLDSSHRVFTNSDVTVFFLEVLPRLNRGVILHIHDVFLPFDYPGAWSSRHYSEQYLLAAYLLAGYPALEVLLPLAYIDRHPALGALVTASWKREVFQQAFARYRQPAGGYRGTSFWLRVI